MTRFLERSGTEITKSKYELNSSTLDPKFRSLIGVIPDSSRDEFRIPKSWILDSTRENFTNMWRKNRSNTNGTVRLQRLVNKSNSFF